MKSSAQMNDRAVWSAESEGPAAAVFPLDASHFAVEESAAALRRIAAERLAAHRSRRASLRGEDEMQVVAAPRVEMGDSAAARVREAVAARYRQSVSYQDFLKAGSREEGAGSREVVAGESEMPGAVTLLAYEPVEEASDVVASDVVAAAEAFRLQESKPVGEFEAALDEEIAFRLAPEFGEHLLEPMALQANIIEFPRQLVAARKARPRLAEGPLLSLSEDAMVEPGAAEEQQLRIFEVAREGAGEDSAEVDVHAEREAEGGVTSAAAWQSGRLEGARAVLPEMYVDPAREAELLRLVELDELAKAEATPDAMLIRESAPVVESALPSLYMPVFTAGIDLRFMAGLVDVACVGAAFALFACVAAVAAGPAMRGMAAWKLESGAALAWVGLFVVYQWLFLTLGEATPGMLYAKLSLCTFADGTPTRKMRQRRVWSQLLAFAPMCLGLAWMLVDTDHLAWHDKQSRTYPRAY